MSEPRVSEETGTATTAGSLLRQARQARGLHVAALASAIKVAPRKLELLEADRLGELPDPTFTRALAQTVCRSLKIDSAPVLALLPRSPGHRLEQVAEGINAPFMERPGRLVPTPGVRGQALWGLAVLLLATLAVYLMPARWWPLQGFAPGTLAERAQTKAATPTTTPAAAPGAGAAPGPSGSVTESVPAFVPAPEYPTAAASAAGEEIAAATPAAAPTGVVTHSVAGPGAAAVPLRLQTSADSWIEVLDANGKALLNRVVKSGEQVELEGSLPLHLKIGNAAATEVVFRGEAVSLKPFTRNNLARVELK